MFLSDIDIAKEVKHGTIVLKPFDRKRLQPVSYDISLGNTFIITEPHTTSIIDPVKKIFPKTHTVTVKNGGTFVLHPGVSILGCSKEHFGSDVYLIEMNGKSSLARIGLLVHNSASLINPGHFLQVTLELCNLNSVPIILRPGMQIAQLTFSTISSRTAKNYRQVGRYQGNNVRGYVAPRKAKKKR
ncbi:dCTP deaminase [Candidatus Kaiserbacteria bacterium RIFCSPHIGHO2_02_FULL_50_9]|uniref:dCTP deaminase n=1 Tax=Candidatus Kaiserbacteria bacterium RIFCSPLOWO2_01_FULL_51_21 TaxID=1798508 RepID=A0A1F6EEH1_9BACT|nr:MAG: dCTP deaminase [Candidatus Kaiserbacteria bacterium RIFCSPHIGHO2_01_FULL_51_33]OGG63780.1 MAG: dCTP deaminase [Candidatus Kaiserbacteria bacterium RIFCSPHIGHO2_02_FULL_50_9]OGG71612.1 MAG: dCTP deaminase [Candidatus Kaiserbacteria bacterium RIFCSPLOWO2_01_FULL_51_21]